MHDFLSLFCTHRLVVVLKADPGKTSNFSDLYIYKIWKIILSMLIGAKIISQGNPDAPTRITPALLDQILYKSAFS